ncbi:MAG: DUF4465 domain-containing protein [Bacteroidales bacterium]|nr:DUF4465 domain-containing protein [Bacteroidales bacterium]
MKKCVLLTLSLLFATIVNAQLSGTYTINSNASQNPSYTSLSAAASALSAGVSGQVIFEIAPGTYEEYVTINEINGTSATNRVIFRGMGADNQQVVVTSNAGYTDNSTIKINGADYVTFENMTVTTTSANKARLLVTDGQTDYNRFYNVRFVGAVSNNNLDGDKNLVYYTSGEWVCHDNEFVGCHFENGYIALYYQGKNIYTLNDGVLVENCTFLNQSFKSVYISFTDNAIVRGNTITNHTHDVLTNYHAMDLLRIRYNSIIENNVMNVTRNSNYATVFETRPAMGTADQPVIIRNNIINFVCNANSSYCVDLDDSNSEYVYFVNNTVKCTGTSNCGSIFVEKNWQNLHIYNNLFVNECSGYVFRFGVAADNRFCDYNRIAFSGSYVGRLGSTDCATLSDWTAASGFDAHSALCTPNFVGNNDLHITSATGLTVANPLSYVATDIDGQNRSATAPCAGADELASGANLPPVVANPISNITFETYPASQTVNLNNTFNDPDDPNENIVITVASNSNPSLVSATLNNRTLTVTRLMATGGTTTITLNAVSAGQSVQTSFSVECIAEDMPPVVANQLAPISFTSYPQTLNFDLSNTFDDPDNNNDFIVITVQTCPSEITAIIDNRMLSVSRTTSSAFTNKTLVIRATSNGKHVDMNVSVSGNEVTVTVGVANFDDVTLGANGYWQGEEGDNEMFSGGWIFTNYYSQAYSFWGGFTASNHTDLTQTGMDAQYTAITAGGYDGSAQYGVAYTFGAQTDVYASDGQAHTVTGCYVTNNLWAYQSVVNGDASSTPFGGTTGNDPDWFKLTATGKNASGQTIGTLDFYLADYRFDNNEEDYVVDTWEWFDLSTLGAVHTISFSLSSTKGNAYGMLTPAYFCIDDFNGTAPLPPTPPQDEPPYVVNPVEDVVFNEFPQTIQVNLDGVATDDDDPDDQITYSIVSNSNSSELTAMMNGKILNLTRISREEGTADLVMRATSDSQYVDFNIHVIINYIPDGIEENDDVAISIYPNPAHDYIRVETMCTSSVQRIDLYDVTGQKVLSSTESEINVSTLPEGVYFVTVFNENKKFVERIIIEK